MQVLTPELSVKINQRLLELHANGLTGSQAAKVIYEETGYPITRNGVIGRWHRMNTPARSKSWISSTNSRSASKARSGRKANRHKKNKYLSKGKVHIITARTSFRKEEDRPRPNLKEPKSKLLGIMALTNKTCKYPTVAEGKYHLFCGHEVFNDHSFCEYHYSICYE